MTFFNFNIPFTFCIPLFYLFFHCAIDRISLFQNIYIKIGIAKLLQGNVGKLLKHPAGCGVIDDLYTQLNAK